MEGKDGAQRRLAFNGGQIFAKMRHARLYLDIAAIAGKKKIELMWLFNGGNAIVVFSNIGTAYSFEECFKEKA